MLCIEFDRDALFGEGGGSASGARRLSELAGQVRGAVRQPHQCARLGGSRFGVLIDYASEAGAEGVARRLIDLQGHGADGVPVAIGIGTWPGAGLSADEILRHVEIAMHRAQQAPRSSFTVHKFGFESWQRRRDRLAQGLEPRRRGRPVSPGTLQPRDSTLPAAGPSRSRRSASKLARPRTRRGRPGAVFLSVAEERGLIGTLDDWVLGLWACGCIAAGARPVTPCD